MSDVKRKVPSIFEKLRGMEGLLSPPALAELITFKVDTLQKRRSKRQRPYWITLSQNRVADDPAEVADGLQTLSTAPADIAEVADEAQEAPAGWDEPKKPEMIRVYDSSLGKYVTKKVGS